MSGRPTGGAESAPPDPPNHPFALTDVAEQAAKAVVAAAG